jgi:hypothetical protein
VPALLATTVHRQLIAFKHRLYTTNCAAPVCVLLLKLALPCVRYVCRRIETISWSPRAFIFHNFLSKEEVDHIVGAVEKLVSMGAAAAATTTGSLS